MHETSVTVPPPWWWPAVEAEMKPQIAALAAESGRPAAIGLQRTFFALALMTQPSEIRDDPVALFPEAVLPPHDWNARHKALRAAVRESRDWALAQAALARLGPAIRGGALPPLPNIPPRRKPAEGDWRQVFSRSTRGPGIAFVRWTSLSHSGRAAEDRECHVEFGTILEICRKFGLVHECISSSAPGHVSSYEECVAFLDGGIVSKAADYVGVACGAWVIGTEARRFLCFELGLTPPRWRSASGPAPSREDLIRSALSQLSAELPALWERMRELQSWDWRRMLGGITRRSVLPFQAFRGAL